VAAGVQLNPFYTTSFTDFEAIQPAMRGFLTIDSNGNYIPDLAARFRVRRTVASSSTLTARG